MTLQSFLRGQFLAGFMLGHGTGLQAPHPIRVVTVAVGMPQACTQVGQLLV